MPKFNRSCLLSVIAALPLFACGVAVGQEAGRWRVAKYKYFAHSDATKLDYILRSMEIEDLRNELQYLEELEAPAMVSSAAYSLNPTTGKIQALLTVHGNWADKAPLEEVQKNLKSTAQQTLGGLKFHLRELSDADVSITFVKVNLEKNEIVNDFAEYKNGELTIRH